MEHKRQISSGITFIAKVILPLAFYTAMIVALVGLTIEGQYGGTLGILFITLTFGTLIYLGFVRLMSVELDNENLFISNYLKTIKVPLTELRDVSQLAIPGNYRPIILHFKSRTIFGPPPVTSKIVNITSDPSFIVSLSF